MNSDTPAEAFTDTRITVHGLDATAIRLAGGDHDGWTLSLDNAEDIAIWISARNDAATLERDRDGLRKLAEAAMQLANKIGRRLGEGGAE